MGEPSSDKAQLSDIKGGIDFDPGKLNLEIQNKGKDFQFNVDPKAIENMHIDGAEFFIINTTPMTNLPLFLGLEENHPEKPATIATRQLTMAQ